MTNTLGDFVSSFVIIFLNCIQLLFWFNEFICASLLLLFFATLSIIQFKTEVKLGVSHNRQKSTCTQTIRLSLAGCARSVLLAL